MFEVVINKARGERKERPSVVIVRWRNSSNHLVDYLRKLRKAIPPINYPTITPSVAFSTLLT